MGGIDDEHRVKFEADRSRLNVADAGEQKRGE